MAHGSENWYTFYTDRVQEDTIIFSVLERAQFARNAPVYQPDAVPVPEFEPATGRRYSLLEYILRQTEQARLLQTLPS